MVPTVKSDAVLRFEGFELNRQSGELRKNGIRLSLQDQPFKVLILLLQRPGEMVTREELRQLIWPEKSFGDFDHAINRSIAKLRSVLGDSSDVPHLIETLPRRGYRFIGTVDNHVKESPEPQLAISKPFVVDSPRVHHHRRTAVIVVSLIIAVALLIGIGTAVLSPKPHVLIEQQLTSNSSETPVTAAAISTSGRYLAYSDETGIHVRLMATAEMHTVMGVPNSKIVQLRWFPDETKLLASVAHVDSVVPSVWSVSILGGPPSKLRDGAEHAVVSPDGSRIAFVTADGKEIWMMDAGGEEPRRILALPEEDRVPGLAWSPDGRQLAYVRAHEATDKFERTIEYCNIDGADHHALVAEPSLKGDLVFLNERLIYTRFEPLPRKTDVNLWETRFDQRTGQARAQPRRISNWSGYSVFGLSVTYDGMHLAFLKGQKQTDAYVADVKPGSPRLENARRLTFDDRNDFPFDWTPDSKAIIFLSDRNGFNDIFKQEIDQRAPEAIVTGPETKWVPAVSADGAWIVYLAFPKDKHFPADEGMFLRVPINGGPAEPIMKARAGSIVQCPRSLECVLNELDPAGKLLLFYAFDPLQGKGHELARMNAGLASFYNWTISRDRSSIAVVVPGEGDGHIRILPVGGGDTRDVTVKGWSNLTFIDWAADGKGWYSSSSSADSITLLYIDLQGHAQVLSEQFGWAVTSPNGHHLALLEWNTISNAWVIGNF